MAWYLCLVYWMARQKSGKPTVIKFSTKVLLKQINMIISDYTIPIRHGRDSCSWPKSCLLSCSLDHFYCGGFKGRLLHLLSLVYLDETLPNHRLIVLWTDSVIIFLLKRLHCTRWKSLRWPNVWSWLIRVEPKKRASSILVVNLPFVDLYHPFHDYRS